MTSRSINEALSDLIVEAKAIAGDARATFGSLTAQQLNWKPNQQQWSIGQCFDHLVTANKSYFPMFDKIIKGRKKNTVWQSMPLLPSFFGKMLIRFLDPASTRKLKAPKRFRPSSSNIDGNIISAFVDQQNQLTTLMKESEGLNLQRIKISSPVSRIITYSLLDAYTIIVVHEKRHFLQARRVLDSSGFPRSASHALHRSSGNECCG